MIFTLKRGTHYGRDGKRYQKGDSVESSRDLVAVFSKGKFERDYAAEQKAGVDKVVSKPSIPLPVSTSEDKIDKTKLKSLSEYGKDITSDFPTADEIEVRVFEKSRWYTVVDLADDSVLNEKKLRRKEVEPFLSQYLSEEDPDIDED